MRKYVTKYLSVHQPVRPSLHAHTHTHTRMWVCVCFVHSFDISRVICTSIILHLTFFLPMLVYIWGSSLRTLTFVAAVILVHNQVLKPCWAWKLPVYFLHRDKLRKVFLTGQLICFEENSWLFYPPVPHLRCKPARPVWRTVVKPWPCLLGTSKGKGTLTKWNAVFSVRPANTTILQFWFWQEH